VVGEPLPTPRELDQSWLVNKPRILAVRAEPAEPRPGDTVTFEALFPDPTGEIATTLWVACPPSEALGLVIACMPAADASATTKGEEPTNGALVIGMQPLFDPDYDVPLDILDKTEDKNEGEIITIQVIGAPDIDMEMDTGVQLDLNVFEIGTKGLVVSEAVTPNNNPVVADFFVNGATVDGKTAQVQAGATITLEAKLQDDSVESYQYINSDGITEERTEEPYGLWYTTSGSIQGDTSIFPSLATSWTAPDTATSGTWWFVIRDRRGGLAWWSQPFEVE
jgi:hypothetical protein